MRQARIAFSFLAVFAVAGCQEDPQPVNQVPGPAPYDSSYDTLDPVAIDPASGGQGPTAFDPAVGALANQPSVPIYPPTSIPTFLENNEIKHAILAVPDNVAQDMFDELYKNGVRGFINFSSIPLNVPTDAYVNNVDLELELETVVFYTRESEKNEQTDT